MCRSQVPYAKGGSEGGEPLSPLFQHSLGVPKALRFIPSLNELYYLTHFKTALKRTEALIKDEEEPALMPALTIFDIFP